MSLMESSGNDLLNMDRGEQIKKGEDMSELLQVNQVKYNYPMDLSLAETRSTRINYADLSNYRNTSGEAIIRCTASTEFIVGNNCYLKFTVAVTTSTGSAPAQNYYLFNDIGGVACFSRLLVESADGTEIERTDNLADAVRTWLALQPNLPYIQSVAEVAGLNGSNYLANTAVNSAAQCGGPSGQQSVEVLIPMMWLSGLFRSKKMIPPQLFSGCRIRLQMQSSPALTFRLSAAGTDANVGFNITNLRLITDSIKLSPMVERKLIEQAGKSGLDFYYQTYWNSNIDFTSNAVSFNINKTVSRASELMFITQSQAGNNKLLGDTYQKTAVNGTTPFNYVSCQARLGSLYFPIQPLTSSTTAVSGAGATGIAPSGATEYYYQYAILGPNHKGVQNSPAVPYTSYSASVYGNTGATGADGSNRFYAVNKLTLEKSSALELSGLPVNNARQLVLNVQYASDFSGQSPAGQTLKTWLGYCKLARCYANNVIVKE